MPTWLALALFVLGCVVFVALLAGGVTGSWRGVWTGFKQFGAYMLIGFVLPTLLVVGYIFMVG